MNDTFITKSGHYGTATGGGGNEPVKKTTWNTYAIGLYCHDAMLTSIEFYINPDGSGVRCEYNTTGEGFSGENLATVATYGKVVADAAVSKDELQPALLRAYIEAAENATTDINNPYNPAFITVID